MAAVDLSLPAGPIRQVYADAVHNDDFPELGMVGPMAGGKSSAAVDRLARRALDYPGIQQVLARDTLVNLKASTLVRFRQRLGALFLPQNGGSENLQEALFRFPPAPHPVTGDITQSVVKGIGLDRVDLENVFKSTEYGGGHLDEADQISSDAHDMFLERSRQEFYHRNKTVMDLCMVLAERWSRYSPKPVMPEDVYQILLDDPLSRIGERQMSRDHPMPGVPTISASWNPSGNDHTWARYVGKPYPYPAPDEAWVKHFMGVREVFTPGSVLREDRHRLRAGAFVKVGDKRGYVQAHDPVKGVVTLVGGEQVPHEQVGLTLQRNCLYFFPHHNLSRDHVNVENTYLMASTELRRKHQLGHVDPKTGRVLPAFVNEPLEAGGHILPEISIERISRAGNLIVGGLDHGGDHATAFVMAMYLARSNTLIFFDEMVKSGESAYANAEEVRQMLVPGCEHLIGYDPAMNARIFDRDADRRIVDNYLEVLGPIMVEGARGDPAFDELQEMLEFKDDFGLRGPMPNVMVTENCVHIRKAFQELMWEDVKRKRHKWIVDVGDAGKIAASVVKRGYTNIQQGAVASGPRYAYATRFAS